MELLGTGNYMRSAPMEYVSLIVQEHIAHDIVERIGELGTVQFIDLNGTLTAFKRYFTPQVKRCDELEKKLKFFEEEMKKHAITPEPYTQAEYTAWLDSQKELLSREHRGMTVLDWWEHVVSERHRDYLAIKAERDRTSAQLYEAVQRRHVIEKAGEFFNFESRAGLGAGSYGGQSASGNSDRSGLLAAAAAGNRDVEGLRAPVGTQEEDELQFKTIAGIIATGDKVRFARIVFRASSGHAVVRFADIPGKLVDEKGQEHVKSVFALFYRGRTLTGKLERICSAFSANTHSIPAFTNTEAVNAALEETKSLINDSIAWLEQERSTSVTTLSHLALVTGRWRRGVAQEKATYHTLNMFVRSERGTVTAQAWVLKSAMPALSEAVETLHTLVAQGGRAQPYYLNVITSPDLPQPPTHFNTNRITVVFQGIVNTYGMPRYGEANPALFSMMTFPFLFGVMYGDVGHAFILTLFGGYLVLKEDALGKRNLGEMLGMCFKGRYMLFLCGLFSIYAGLVYNDMFSLAMNGFGGTRWTYPVVNGTHYTSAVKTSGAWDDVYTFGVDPEWHLADNDLLFFNSLKMKMAVIFGIIQMVFGLFLKLTNALHFKAKYDLFFEVIPQITFMVLMFGYMVVLIVLKWCIDWNDPLTRPGAPPSLIDTLINIALKPGVITNQMYEGQAGVQVVLLLVSFLMVPIMLLGKPIALLLDHKRQMKHKDNEDHDGHGLLSSSAAGSSASGTGLTGADGSSTKPLVLEGGAAGAHGAHSHEHMSPAELADLAATQPIILPGQAGPAGGGHHGDEFSFGEVFIHSAIESIEFVLGAVSNTASYLRLWALSLAHSQLATVFWERALVSTVESKSAVMIFVGWGVWAGITFAVLNVMDVLECFLHALRLHWVEFMNKFVKCDGYKFMPLSFDNLLTNNKDD